jgi:acetylornithine deacetylase/succinyl-diaminopimelate desuccinylase-like protein
MSTSLDHAYEMISNKWDTDIIPTLEKYIKIPNQSIMFDPDWKKNGHMDKAAALLKSWCEAQNIDGMKVELIEKPGKTPVLFIEIPGQSDKTILLYGHMDKQPEMRGWDEDLGPWKPVIKDDKLYGRGGADDGYSTFCALNAIETLHALKIPHARCVILIEASEESGSPDLPDYLSDLAPRIGTPDLIICLDSGCGNYHQLWSTTSLRGLINGTLKIAVLTEGVHSGYGSGVIPSIFMVLRQLLERIENAKTGDILLQDLQVNIPKERMEQAKKAAEFIGEALWSEIPFAGNTQPVSHDVSENIINRTWKPALSVVGMNNLPPTQNAGNVTLPDMELKLSMRLPPTCDVEKASKALKKALESDPPFGAVVSLDIPEGNAGWEAPPLAEWLKIANENASQLFFKNPAAYVGEGGSIPFMGMLGKMFPQAQFLITGVLGPKSNAHGPNEFLHIPMAKKLTGCVAHVIAQHFEQTNKSE